MRDLLEAAFSPTQLNIIDDSWQHAGHAGVAEHGGGHFSVEITSKAFAGKGRVQCHRMVTDVLRPMFKSDIHALSISARIPASD